MLRNTIVETFFSIFTDANTTENMSNMPNIDILSKPFKVTGIELLLFKHLIILN